MLLENPALLEDKKAAALRYAGQGLAIFPCWWTDANGVCACPKGAACTSAGKHPIGDLARNGLKDATESHETINAWWDRYPKANIGVPTGSVNGFDVLDIDPRHGGDQSWNSLKEQHPEVKEIKTLFVTTPGGGFHLYYVHRDGISNRRGSLPNGIDVRGDGGYVLLPPSEIAGRAYKWGQS